jgi:hypothetical protein
LRIRRCDGRHSRQRRYCHGVMNETHRWWSGHCVRRHGRRSAACRCRRVGVHWLLVMSSPLWPVGHRLPWVLRHLMLRRVGRIVLGRRVGRTRLRDRGIYGDICVRFHVVRRVAVRLLVVGGGKGRTACLRHTRVRASGTCWVAILLAVTVRPLHVLLRKRAGARRLQGVVGCGCGRGLVAGRFVVLAGLVLHSRCLICRRAFRLGSVILREW